MCLRVCGGGGGGGGNKHVLLLADLLLELMSCLLRLRGMRKGDRNGTGHRQQNVFGRRRCLGDLSFIWR